MASSERYYEAENARHRDLDLRRLSPDEAGYVLEQLCDLTKLKRPKLKFVTRPSGHHEYQPTQNRILLDLNDLTMLSLVHELALVFPDGRLGVLRARRAQV
jgi:hypothetical protein